MRGVALDVRVFFSCYEEMSQSLRVEVHRVFMDYLDSMFESTTLLSCHDPLLNTFMLLEEEGGCDLRIFADRLHLNDSSPLTFEHIGQIVLRELTNAVAHLSGIRIQRLELIQRTALLTIYPHDLTS